MKKLATAFAFLGLMAVTSQAEAHGRHFTQHRHYHHTSRARHHYAYRVTLPGPCYVAARMGGPCGCTAESKIFGTTEHVLNGMNLWLAREWHRFPRSLSPQPGDAAIWGNYHVEAIIANNGDGTVTTDGPYGQRRVRISSVSIVNPRGGLRYATFERRKVVHRRYVSL
jgi:hypothetical protein